MLIDELGNRVAKFSDDVSAWRRGIDQMFVERDQILTEIKELEKEPRALRARATAALDAGNRAEHDALIDAIPLARGAVEKAKSELCAMPGQVHHFLSRQRELADRLVPLSMEVTAVAEGIRTLHMQVIGLAGVFSEVTRLNELLGSLPSEGPGGKAGT